MFSDKTIKIIMAIMFLSCLLDWEYGYYQMVRFVGMVVFGYLAYRSHQAGQELYTWIYGLSAVLINPIFKISLGRTIWNLVDVIWAIFLISTLFQKKPTKSASQDLHLRDHPE